VRVTHLRHVVVGSPEPEELAGFYERVWGLRRAGSGPDAVYLRGAGPEHHILVVRRAPRPSIAEYSLGLADRDAVDQAAKELASTHGVVVLGAPAEIPEPGGGYGFAIADADGRRVVLSAEVDAAPPLGDAREVEPVKISHLVVNSPDAPGFAQLFVDVLGFRLADEMPHMLFLRCNADHHSVAVVRAPHASLNHIAFELPTVEHMLKGVDRMHEHGFEVLWGPGRHGPGNNVFGYFLSPNRQVIEYTSEVEQIADEDDSAPRMWLPEEMPVPDTWADPRSARPTAFARELMLGDDERAAAPSPDVPADGNGAGGAR
jgi:catechol 2,3-dioxygenase-like lactoylglutathione lyase family enzyme